MRVAWQVAAVAAVAAGAALLLAASGRPAAAGRPRSVRYSGLDARPANPACLAPSANPSLRVSFAPALGGASLEAPTAAAQSPVAPDVWYVAERAGRVRRVDAATGGAATALDLTPSVWTAGEGGLLGIALHPAFAQNGHAFVYYTISSTSMRSIVARFTSQDGGLTFAPASQRVILDVPQPNVYHLGGDVHFGPEGLLYVGLGDGEVDPGTAQDPGDLHGKLLRVDVDAGNPYAIPPGNPFAAGGGAPEVFALGLRNPFRWSFDALSGALWLADVGQYDYEEIDLISPGGNYGWPNREGLHCRIPGACDDPSYLDPAFEYDHGQGCAVIGGFVYRGTALPSLSGAYLYGDYCSLRIWSALPNGDGSFQVAELATSPEPFTGFAQGSDGEVLVLQGGGAVRLAPPAGPVPDPLPLHLADTGCVDPADPRRAAAGLIPFDVIQPLWSDGASKERWLALPDGARITIGADGDFSLPPRSVALKHFRLGGKLIETRLFVRHGDGSYGGYTYEWNDAETDALLLSGAKQRQVAGQTWSYPSREQCMQCHTAAAGFSLGLETAQLNRDLLYPRTGRTANQMATLAYVGVFDAPLPGSAGTLARLERDTGDHAVRGYLHANCSGCHRANGTTGTSIDLRYGPPSTALGLCDVAPGLGDLGVPGASLLAPGDPARSVLSLRAHRIGSGQMPPLARAVVDAAGTAALDTWIRSWPSCSGPDGDDDGRPDGADNCPGLSNPAQNDSDADGVGDACETACRDRVDNDADGRVDYPADPGCRTADSTAENPACDNGLDDDADGKADGPPDLGCSGSSGTREDPPCADRVDNDGDGRIDFDGGAWFNGGSALTAADAQCAGIPSAGESAPRSCGLGFELAPALALLVLLRRRAYA
jgi:uncharacterized repeat protein (TIGR03806 family)